MMSMSTESSTNSKFFAFGEDFSKFEFPTPSGTPIGEFPCLSYDYLKKMDIIRAMALTDTIVSCTSLAAETLLNGKCVGNYLLSDASPTVNMIKPLELEKIIDLPQLHPQNSDVEISDYIKKVMIQS